MRAARIGALAGLTALSGAAAAQNILVLGDSLSAAYGIPSERGWVALLQKKLLQEKSAQRSSAPDSSGAHRSGQQSTTQRSGDAEKLPNVNVGDINVVNASISGDTTDGGLMRLPPLLEKYRPTIVVIELGANDGLRGFQIRRLRGNLEQLIQLSQKSNAKVLLLGIKIPPNYGLRYTSEFYESYTLLARQYDLPLVPFFLDGVATHPELMQADGLHPRAEAQARLLENVWPYLQKML